MHRLLVAGSILTAGLIGLSSTAEAWVSANRWGGSTARAGGYTTHTNAWGGSTTHAWAGGTTHTNTYGGTTSGAYGAGYSHTYAGGGTVYHPPAYGYGGYGYHPPVAVPYYGGGCYGCAAAAGAVAGLATGAVVGAAAASAANANATANAYSAGVAAGSAYPMGMQYAALPAGCAMTPVGGATYYTCGGAWFLPSYGANGVYYRVVPAP